MWYRVCRKSLVNGERKEFGYFNALYEAVWRVLEFQYMDLSCDVRELHNNFNYLMQFRALTFNNVHHYTIEEVENV